MKKVIYVLGGELCIHFPDIKIFASLGGVSENSERLNYSSREMIPYFLDFSDFKKIN